MQMLLWDVLGCSLLFLRRGPVPQPPTYTHLSLVPGEEHKIEEVSTEQEREFSATSLSEKIKSNKTKEKKKKKKKRKEKEKNPPKKQG